jgi:hypothetical protein
LGMVQSPEQALRQRNGSKPYTFRSDPLTRGRPVQVHLRRSIGLKFRE